MLRPQDNEKREARVLDGLWDFALDRDGTGRSDGWWRSTLVAARSMPVPSSYNDIYVDTDLRDHVGDVWYQRNVFVPRGWSEERIALRFDAATHRAVVWVDDIEVAGHEGGYTPFEVDLTENVARGSSTPALLPRLF
jgi:beta-glucuronidase